MKVTGTLTNLYIGDKVNKWGKVKIDFVVAGVKYGLFRKPEDVKFGVVEGDTVTFEAEQSGQFWNIKGNAPEKAVTGAISTPSNAPQGANASGADRGAEIRKEWALNAAIATVAMQEPFGLPDTELFQIIFRFASRYEKLVRDQHQWDLQVELLTPGNEK